MSGPNSPAPLPTAEFLSQLGRCHAAVDGAAVARRAPGVRPASNDDGHAITQQSALPGLANDTDGVPESRWLAVPGASDLERLRSMVASLPGILRVAEAGPAAPTGEPATVVL